MLEDDIAFRAFLGRAVFLVAEVATVPIAITDVEGVNAFAAMATELRALAFADGSGFVGAVATLLDMITSLVQRNAAMILAHEEVSRTDTDYTIAATFI